MPSNLVTGAIIALAGCVVGSGAALLADSDELAGFPEAKQASPDTAPAEFAYLDNARVLAYMGQIEGGLATSQTRTLSAKTTAKASLSAKEIAAAETSSERLRGSSQTVTLTEADRFYTLLRILRARQTEDGESGFKTLVDIDVTITGSNSVDRVREGLERVEEGDFVRIRNAHVFIPTYAAVLPRARFASYYLGGPLKLPRRALYAPVSRKARVAVARYQARLKENARIPMVLPTLHSTRRELERVVTFFIPARYQSLSSEASLLGGELTVVGKVVYKDPRLPDEVATNAPLKPTYLDRETLTTFAPALRRADPLLLKRLNMERDRIVDQVRESLSIKAPVAVIIPVAIYQ